MPRYYFHLTREGERIADDEGARLDPADLKAELLLRLLEKMRHGEYPELIEEWRGWSVEITDEDDRVIQVIVI
jgi:hypothetical protein